VVHARYEVSRVVLRRIAEVSNACPSRAVCSDSGAEVALCGHATLATSVVLLDTKRVLPTQTIHYHTLYVCTPLAFHSTIRVDEGAHLLLCVSWRAGVACS
jgi:hypothetical protein